MSGTTPVTIRLRNDQIAVYELRAAVKHMKLSTYIASLLKDQENSAGTVKDEVIVLQNKLDEMQDMIIELHDIINGLKPDNNNDNQNGYVASIQALFLLRAMAKPSHIDLVNNKLTEMRLPTLS